MVLSLKNYQDHIDIFKVLVLLVRVKLLIYEIISVGRKQTFCL